MCNAVGHTGLSASYSQNRKAHAYCTLLTCTVQGRQTLVCTFVCTQNLSSQGDEGVAPTGSS